MTTRSVWRAKLRSSAVAFESLAEHDVFDLGLDEQGIDDRVAPCFLGRPPIPRRRTVLGSVSTANRPGAGESP